MQVTARTGVLCRYQRQDSDYAFEVVQHTDAVSWIQFGSFRHVYQRTNFWDYTVNYPLLAPERIAPPQRYLLYRTMSQEDRSDQLLAVYVQWYKERSLSVREDISQGGPS